MKNTVIVQINYSFKGEDFSPSISLELDVFAKTSDNFTGMHTKIAQQNKIDTYSYSFDAMEAYPLIFHSPAGNVVGFVENGECDLAGYQVYLKKNKMMEEVGSIAMDILEISDINQKDNRKIKEALIKSYNAGVKNIDHINLR